MDLSLDYPSFQGGNPALLVVNPDDEFGQMAGDTLAATIELKNIEPAEGRRSRVRSLRLIGDPTEVTATLNSRMKIGDSETVRTASSMRDSGRLPIRANGRFHTLTVTIPAGHSWTHVQGMEMELERGDNR